MHVSRQPFSGAKSLKKIGSGPGKRWSRATTLVVFSQPGVATGRIGVTRMKRFEHKRDTLIFAQGIHCIMAVSI
jgi:peroxiredoxin